MRMPEDDAWIQAVRGTGLRDARTQELWGWIQGLVAAKEADGGLESLGRWLERQECLHTEWPGEAVRSMLEPTHGPGWGSSPQDLKAARVAMDSMQRMLGVREQEAREHEVSPAVAYDEVDPKEIEFEGSHWVFTGMFVYCGREVAELATQALGGKVRGGPAKKGDYLVVGSHCHPGWIHSKRGRKIETVERWRKEGSTKCRIVSERTWAEALHFRGREGGKAR